MTQLETAAADDGVFRRELRAWLESAYARFVRGWPGGAGVSSHI